MSYETLQNQDPEVFASVKNEINRQESSLEMIASENFVSKAVLEAAGSPLTNKRYYGGCEFVDVSEDIARDRAKKLFGAEFANVQPHSGSQANLGVFMAALEAGDTFMGMDLSEGGHLTHGSPVNFSGKLYKAVPYGLNHHTGRLDFDQVRDLAKKHQPKMIICGASAYPRQIDCKQFKDIADEVGAVLMADIAHPAGLVAAGLHPDPVPHCDFVTTTTHKTLRGPRGGMILCKEKWAKKVNSRIFPGIQGGPLMHVIAAKAVAFGEALKPEFKTYAQNVIDNCQALASVFLENDYQLVTGGTDNHLILLDLSDKELSGKDAEESLERAGITTNKNTVPGEKRSPFVTSGLRIGTAALTTRGMTPDDMKQIATWMIEVLRDHENADLAKKIQGQVQELCGKYPLYK